MARARHCNIGICHDFSALTPQLRQDCCSLGWERVPLCLPRWCCLRLWGPRHLTLEQKEAWSAVTCTAWLMGPASALSLASLPSCVLAAPVASFAGGPFWGDTLEGVCVFGLEDQVKTASGLALSDARCKTLCPLPENLIDQHIFDFIPTTTPRLRSLQYIVTMGRFYCDYCGCYLTYIPLCK
jgi:hypothetical protein